MALVAIARRMDITKAKRRAAGSATTTCYRLSVRLSTSMAEAQIQIKIRLTSSPWGGSILSISSNVSPLVTISLDLTSTDRSSVRSIKMEPRLSHSRLIRESAALSTSKAILLTWFIRRTVSTCCSASGTSRVTPARSPSAARATQSSASSSQVA